MSKPLTMDEFWKEFDEICRRLDALRDRYVETFGTDDREGSIPSLLGSVGLCLDEIDSKWHT